MITRRGAPSTKCEQISGFAIICSTVRHCFYLLAPGINLIYRIVFTAINLWSSSQLRRNATLEHDARAPPPPPPLAVTTAALPTVVFARTCLCCTFHFAASSCAAYDCSREISPSYPSSKTAGSAWCSMNFKNAGPPCMQCNESSGQANWMRVSGGHVAPGESGEGEGVVGPLRRSGECPPSATSEHLRVACWPLAFDQ